MTALVWVGFVAAGATGALARSVLDRAVTSRIGGPLPWGTFVINVTGSFLFGLLTGLGLSHGLPRTPRVVLGTGFCGAYTTFSTFTYETIRLFEEGAPADALRNAAGTFVAATLAAAAGLAVAAL